MQTLIIAAISRCPCALLSWCTLLVHKSPTACAHLFVRTLILVHKSFTACAPLFVCTLVLVPRTWHAANIRSCVRNCFCRHK